VASFEVMNKKGEGREIKPYSKIHFITEY